MHITCYICINKKKSDYPHTEVNAIEAYLLKQADIPVFFISGKLSLFARFQNANIV